MAGGKNYNRLQAKLYSLLSIAMLIKILFKLTHFFKLENVVKI